MKNTLNIFVLILATVLLFSCEQDNHTLDDFAKIEQQNQENSIEDNTKETDNQVDILTMPVSDSIQLDYDKNAKEEIESRSGLTKIYSKTWDIRSGYVLRLRDGKQDLDPNCKYIIKVTRYSGDPDLFVYGGSYSRAERKIRRATFYNDGTGREDTYAYRSDLLNSESHIYYSVYADGSNDARFKIEIFKDCSDTGGSSCSNIPSNCEQVSCTPTVFNNDGGYGCTISCQFDGDYSISYWEVNGERKNTTSSSPKFTVTASGNYTICCYFRCNGNLYKCCRVVTCPPNDNNGDNCCTTDVLTKSWLKNIMNDLCDNDCSGEKIYCATYQGRSVINVTPWEGCTHGTGEVYTCNGSLIGTYGGYNGGTLNSTPDNIRLLWDSDKDCGNNSSCNTLQKEDFQSYQIRNKIGATSNQWATWDNGQEGNAQDAYVMNEDYFGIKKHLHLSNDRIEDVIYKLGNRRSGKYELSFQMNVQDAGYFNIQKDQYNRVSGGLFGVTFNNNGTFQVKTNSGGRSSTFNYNKNQWIDIKLEADFSRNSYKITIAGRAINITSAQGFSQLGAINFYAIDNAAFSVDNIVLKSCN